MRGHVFKNDKTPNVTRDPAMSAPIYPYPIFPGAFAPIVGMATKSLAFPPVTGENWHGIPGNEGLNHALQAMQKVDDVHIPCRFSRKFGPGT